MEWLDQVELPEHHLEVRDGQFGLTVAGAWPEEVPREVPREVPALSIDPGTDAHELPMVTAALAASDDELRESSHRVLEDWCAEHDGDLRVLLPDTFGTEAFLRGAPAWPATWTGIRIVSGGRVPSPGPRVVGQEFSASSRSRLARRSAPMPIPAGLTPSPCSHFSYSSTSAFS